MQGNIVWGRMKKYDYLVVGSGLFGAVFTHFALKKGKSVLVLEKRDHIGGNVYTENVYWRTSATFQYSKRGYVVRRASPLHAERVLFVHPQGYASSERSARIDGRVANTRQKQHDVRTNDRYGFGLYPAQARILLWFVFDFQNDRRCAKARGCGIKT